MLVEPKTSRTLVNKAYFIIWRPGVNVKSVPQRIVKEVIDASLCSYYEAICIHVYIVNFSLFLFKRIIGYAEHNVEIRSES